MADQPCRFPLGVARPRRPRRMRVRASGRDVGLVELEPAFHEGVGNGVTLAQFREQVGDRVAPGLGAHNLEDRLDSLLGGLLGGKAGPFVVASVHVAPGMPEIALGLVEPVTAALHPTAPSSADPYGRRLSRGGPAPDVLPNDAGRPPSAAGAY